MFPRESQILTIGPENPTLTEHIVNIVRLPYFWGALLFTLPLTAPAQFLAAYIDTRSIGEAFRFTFNLSYTGSSIPSQMGILNQSVWFLTILSLINLTHFMRLKLIATEPELIALSPEGKETVHGAFKLVSKIIPQAILGILFISVSLPSINSFATPGSIFAVGPIIVIWNLISTVLLDLMFGCFIWIYASSLWGLHKLGKEPLKLKPYFEDIMLGARPIGSIALTLFLAYFTVAGLGTLSILLAPDQLGTVLLTGLTVAGVALFFLPLNSIHRHMQREKHLQQASIRRELAQLNTQPAPNELKSQRDPLSRVSELMTLQMRRDDAAKIPTWPLDTTILSRFAAVIISLITILISRVIIVALRL